MLNGQFRRSYVLWQELIPPFIVLEFVSGDGSEERDRTPLFRVGEAEKPGKFWIYEQIIRPAFYGIYEVSRASVEVYCLVAGEYQLLPANERDHFPISSLGVELGIWQGRYQNAEAPWLRWWDEQGNLLLTGWERVEQTQLELQQEQEKVERLMAQLRAQGIEPEV